MKARTAIIGVTAAAVAAGAFTTADATSGHLTPLGVYETGQEGGSEIVAVDALTARMFVTNGADNTIDIIDISDPDTPTLLSQIDLGPYGAGVQSVAVTDGVVAAAIKADDDLANGTVATFETDGTPLAAYEVGVLPDAIAFTDDGRYIIVANEAEPVCDDEALLSDPEGSVSIIDLVTEQVETAGFASFNDDRDDLLAAGVRIFFPGSTVAQDLEPEYVTTTGDTAFVTLQENNAIAVVDIPRATVTDIVALGYKDHSRNKAGLDPSNRDDAEAIERYDVLGMYQPDAIATTEIGGSTYLLTANEGDARDYDCYSEEDRVKDYGLGDAYDDTLDDDALLGRLKTTSAFPTTFDDNGHIEQVYSYGARSFTVWDTDGNVVDDSGDEFARILRGTPFFNLDETETDERSDDKGAEPEALAVGTVGKRTYAFIGLERSGGVMMYDVSNPNNVRFVDYVNTAEVENGQATLGGDVGPEGIAFVSAADSPTGKALLAVSFEISGSTRLFEVN